MLMSQENVIIKFFLLCVAFLSLAACNGKENRSLAVAESSSSILFSNSWKNKEAYKQAHAIRVYRMKEDGIFDQKKLEKRGEVILDLEGQKIGDFITFLREVCSRDGVSPKEMHPFIHVAMVDREKKSLAYWQFRKYKDDAGDDALCVITPTGGIFKCPQIDLFLEKIAAKVPAKQ